MAEEIINKVAQSGIITLDLADFSPVGDRIAIDLAPRLHMGMVLREKDFREYIKTENWSAFKEKHVAIFCSVEAIIPVWAYMLLASALQPFAATIVFGNLEMLEIELFRQKMEQNLNIENLAGKKVVIKGCGDVKIPDAVFVLATTKIRAVADKIMYGEPCSMVPVFKR